MLTHLKTSFKFEHSRTLTGVQWLGWAVYVAEVDRQMCVQHMWWMACFSDMVITMHPPHQLGQVCKFFLHIYLFLLFTCICSVWICIWSPVFERGAAWKNPNRKIMVLPDEVLGGSPLTCLTIIPVFSDTAAKIGTKLRCSAKNNIQIKLDFIP